MLIALNLKTFKAVFNLASTKYVRIEHPRGETFQLVATHLDETTTIIYEGSQDECVTLLKSMIRVTEAPFVKLDRGSEESGG